MPVLYYIYEGLKRVEKRSRLRRPIDIKTSKDPSLDTKLIGEVASVEELLMFVSDYRWAKGFNYFLRETEEIYSKVKVRLLDILHTKTDRRAGEAPVAPEALGNRRPRKYRTYLRLKYLKTKTHPSKYLTRR